MQFSMGFQTAYLEAAIGIGHFVGLFGMLLLGFAVMFQFPAGVFLLVKTGMISLERVKSMRAIIFVVILVISALLTPPDVVSQLMMGIPTYLLFELGLLAASLGRPKAPSQENQDENQDEPLDEKE
jgi:sec-independent protein translocase protein TatC